MKIETLLLYSFIQVSVKLAYLLLFCEHIEKYRRVKQFLDVKCVAILLYI